MLSLYVSCRQSRNKVARKSRHTISFFGGMWSVNEVVVKRELTVTYSHCDMRLGD